MMYMATCMTSGSQQVAQEDSVTGAAGPCSGRGSAASWCPVHCGRVTTRLSRRMF